MTDQPTYSTLLNSGVQPPGSQPDSLGSLRQLGQYRIVKQLGRGGMGVVYQAEDTQLNRLAALKVMRADYAADSGARARFIREAQAAARLKHDHIVTIYQVGEENDVPFLAMEFLTGKSLEDWLRPDRRATVMEALLISKQVARGLSAAHAANLIHRDIKPANLWLEAPRGRVKILDFGLARYSGADYPALTQDGSVIGTPAFMAPEQARGDLVDHRSDLFSLGCVMYRMLTGRLPFQGNTLYAVLSAIASETPLSPRTVRSEIPIQLSELVDQLLAKKPDDRPASAQAVLEELVAIEQHAKQPEAPEPAIFQTLSPPAMVRPRRKRMRLQPLLVGAYAVIAIAGLAIVTAAWRTNQHGPAALDAGGRASASLGSVTPPTIAAVSSPRLPAFWFGHSVLTPALQLSEFADHVNFVMDYSWEMHGDITIQAARKHKILVVLVVRSNSVTELSKALVMARSNRDVVVGICFENPYYNGYSPEDVAQFGQLVRGAAPWLQRWAGFVEKPRGNYQQNPIPSDIDVVVLNIFYARNPTDVQQKRDDVMQGWLSKAAGRPMLLHWNVGTKSPPGLVPSIVSTTVDALDQVAQESNLAGLVLGHYKTHDGKVGIQENTALVQEIQELARSRQIKER